MNYIITKNKEFFNRIGNYNFCDIEELKTLPNLIAFDTETTSLFPRMGEVFSIQIGTGKDNYIIDLQKHSDPNKIIEFKDAIPYLKDKELVGHNLTFDLGWCYKYGLYPENVRDTFIASKLLYNGYPTYFRHGFGFVMERELGIQYDKSEQQNIAKNQLKTTKSIEYAFNDVDRLLELEKVLSEKLESAGSTDTYILHNKYIRALAYMEFCGMPLDKKSWQLKMDNDLKELEEKEANVIDYIYNKLPQFRDNQLSLFSTENNISISITSPKQMISVFKALGINCEDNEGNPSIDKGIISKSDHEFVDIWLEYTDIKHDVTTYGQNILDKIEDNTIYTSFNPILDTARISTRKEGINILNFPANKKTRECVKAAPGWKLIVCDFEGRFGLIRLFSCKNKIIFVYL